MKSFPSTLCVRWNRFRVCSACDEIRSEYAQHAMKSFPLMLSMRSDVHVKTVEICTLAEHTRKFFRVCSVCSYATCVIKLFPHMLSMCIVHAIIFENCSNIPLKMQISIIKNRNFEKPSMNSSNRTKVTILKKKNLITRQKNLILRMLSHSENVWTSKF